MLPSVINNFLFEKSYIFDCVSLIYPNRRVSNIIPYSFTRKYKGAKSHFVDDSRSFYYGYFLISVDSPASQLVILNSGGFDALAFDTTGYKSFQPLALANIIALRDEEPGVILHFIGYKIQMEDKDVRADFYFPPIVDTTVVLVTIQNQIDVPFVVFLNDSRIDGVFSAGSSRAINIPRAIVNLRLESPDGSPMGAPARIVSAERNNPAIENVYSYQNFGITIQLSTSNYVDRVITVNRPAGPSGQILVSASLSDTGGIDNETRVSFTMPEPLTGDITFKLGRCVVNTSSGILYCYGTPEGGHDGVGGDFNDYRLVTIPAGTSYHSISLTPSPGASFGIISKIRCFDIESTTVVFTKDPNDGGAWVLQLT